MTPGLSYYAREFAEVATPEEFAQAAVELALVDPEVVTGRTIGHLQVLDGSFRAFQRNESSAGLGLVRQGA